MEILELQHVHDVFDVGGKSDFGIGQVSPFTQSGESRRVNVVPTVTQNWRDFPPAPATKPSWMHQDEYRFGDPLRGRRGNTNRW